LTARCPRKARLYVKEAKPTKLVRRPQDASKLMGLWKKRLVARMATIRRKQLRDEWCKTVNLLSTYVEAKLDKKKETRIVKLENANQIQPNQ